METGRGEVVERTAVVEEGREERVVRGRDGVMVCEIDTTSSVVPAL